MSTIIFSFPVFFFGLLAQGALGVPLHAAAVPLHPLLALLFPGELQGSGRPVNRPLTGNGVPALVVIKRTYRPADPHKGAAGFCCHSHACSSFDKETFFSLNAKVKVI